MINEIIRDLFDIPLVLVSRRGWGKSSSLKHIIEKVKEQHPDTIIKVFDSSLSWKWTSPTKYYQIVTTEKILSGQIENIGDCVYILSMGKTDTRDFIASVVEQDYRERLTVGLTFGEMAVKSLPLLVYIIEESNTIFSSSSLLRSDKASETFNSFLSIGRNLQLSGIFVCTRLKELATGIRERSGLIVGKILGESDLRMVKSVTDKRTRDLSKTLSKYNFLYNHKISRIPDTCKNVPMQYLRIVNPFRYNRITPKPKLSLVSKAFALVQLVYCLIGLGIMIPLTVGLFWVIFSLF